MHRRRTPTTGFSVAAAGLPPAFVLTPGQAAGCPRFITVLDKIRVPGRVGRASDPPLPRWPATRPTPPRPPCLPAPPPDHGGHPEKTDQRANRKRRVQSAGGPIGFDPERYQQRNTVERCFQKIKTWRGLATRYDKAPESYEAGLHLRGSWLKLLTSTT
ncbi:IS5 family transposase [Acrocarpospora corrugata]|uniref:IS5 family transposase n=1 Tax=Acrocarpospora corrugata TaxID=35763 RepID=A0A5M3W678_9ACTN|nr:IS5 family transposase [Acrocarpospora corrugata]